MIFTSFKALNGDSFLISADDTNILIDGGTPNTYGQISNSIDENPLSAVFITHVDYDHIGGVINLIKDVDLDISTCSFYMNHPDLAAEYLGDEVGYKHGTILKDIMSQRDKTFRELKAEDCIIIDNMTISVLSPKEAIQDELYHYWNASRVILDGEMTYMERDKRNGDIINKSSLVLLVTHNSRTVLLLGDSHASTVCEALSENLYSEDNPLALNLLKISHHGSKHNTNLELLKIISCQHFYISTNGGTHDHPDCETIQLLQDRAEDLGTTFIIYLNYDIESDIRDKCAFDMPNLDFRQENRIEV